MSKAIELADLQYSKPPGIVVCLGGDMVGGSIHPELKSSNDMTPIQAVLWLRERLIWTLTTLADHFGHVYVPCVSGNHGRNTGKVEFKNFVHENFDWQLYCLLEAHFKTVGDTRVVFTNPESNQVLFSIYDTRFLLKHGHDLGVKGGDGIIGSIGPITRGTMKVGKLESQTSGGFDFMLLAHWHQTLWLQNVIVNNTLKGYDEFAHKALCAPFSLPQQLMFWVHPKHGVTTKKEILLEDRKVKKSGWVSVFNIAA